MTGALSFSDITSLLVVIVFWLHCDILGSQYDRMVAPAEVESSIDGHKHNTHFFSKDSNRNLVYCGAKRTCEILRTRFWNLTQNIHHMLIRIRKSYTTINMEWVKKNLVCYEKVESFGYQEKILGGISKLFQVINLIFFDDMDISLDPVLSTDSQIYVGFVTTASKTIIRSAQNQTTSCGGFF